MVLAMDIERTAPQDCSEEEVGLSMGRRVLLAEDDDEMCRLLAETLRGDGFEVVCTANGLELLEKINGYRGEMIGGRFFDVDLIVSDMRMPWVGGLEVLRQLRERDRVTPVIMITAFGDERTHADAYHLGATAVIDKPFDLDAFREIVKMHLEQ